MNESKVSVEDGSFEKNFNRITEPFDFEIGEEEEEYEFEDEHFEQSVEQISEKAEKDSLNPTITRKKKTSEKSILPDDNELRRLYDPSYRNLILGHDGRLIERMKNFRTLFKSELKNIIAQQVSAFDSVKVHRLYKTGIRLPAWIFLDNNTGYTFQEVERLRFLLSHDIF